MLKNNQPATPDIRELTISDASTKRTLKNLRDMFDRLNRNVNSLMVTRANTPAAPVANLLWNGEVGHSVNSWHDTAYASATDKAKEAAWFYSHNKPATLRTFADAAVNTGTDRVNLPGHDFTTGQTVDVFNTGGALPVGLAAATTYFLNVSGDNVGFCSTIANAFAGTLIDITSAAGGGTHTVQEKLIADDGRTTSVNNTLKTTAHTTYSARYSRWNSSNGWAELTDTKCVDILLPGNLIDATTPLARVSLFAALKNNYIEIPAACLMGTGVWDNTSAQRKFLAGSIGLSASVAGTPALTVERRYRVLFTSDRGYQLLSPEVTVANAPRDSTFSSVNYVAISWLQQAGQLQVDIYEYLPTGPEGASGPVYRLLRQESSATSYIHQGSFLPVTVSGYPTPTGTERTATYFTETGDLQTNLAPVLSSWITINFPNQVPNNYNKANTTDRQWLRIWLTVPPNLFVTGCTTDGSTTLTAPAACFDAEYDSLFDAGTLVAEIYDANDTLITTTTVASRTDDTHVVLGTAIAAGANRKIRIVGGGFHGVYIDKIHLGYQQNTSYAPNAFDIRTLQPLAAPTSSTQPTGPGGNEGGTTRCVVADTPVKLYDRTWIPIDEGERGMLWAAGSIEPNYLVDLKPGVEWVRLVRAANGVWIECTDTEAFVVSGSDFSGTPLYRMRVGDPVMTEIDDRWESSTIVEISSYRRQDVVYTPSLSNSHLFVAGRLEQTRWQRFLNWIFRRRRQRGGFLLHNVKPIETTY